MMAQQRSPIQGGAGDLYENEDDYQSMAELDEENINWGRFCARICSIVLLIGGIILVRFMFLNTFADIIT